MALDGNLDHKIVADAGVDMSFSIGSDTWQREVRVQNGLKLMAGLAYYQQMATGVILIAAVWLDPLRSYGRSTQCAFLRRLVSKKVMV